MYELFEHTADLGLRVWAATLEDLLADAGCGLLAMLVANPESVQPAVTRTIALSATEPAYLLFDWLSELLFAFETERLLLGEFEIAIQPSRGGEQAGYTLTAICRGEPMDPARHAMDHEVKAITYHALRVEHAAGRWEAEVIVDI